MVHSVVIVWILASISKPQYITSPQYYSGLVPYCQIQDGLSLYNIRAFYSHEILKEYQMCSLYYPINIYSLGFLYKHIQIWLVIKI